VAGVFGSLAEMYSEILTAIATEFAHAPLRLFAEVMQFAVLLGIVWVVAIGFGKRRGFVANMLTERRERVAAHVETASHADEALADAKREAAATARTARATAREIVMHAKKECVEIEQTAHAETDADCARIEERAEAALSTERQEMLLELREQLVDLVSSATRSIMNEKLTLSEQRTLIENTIAESVNASAGGDARIQALAAGGTSEGA
jgi:F0F1-type ATP synthase membrane subunit b/b'